MVNFPIPGERCELVKITEYGQPNYYLVRIYLCNGKLDIEEMVTSRAILWKLVARLKKERWHDITEGEGRKPGLG